MKRKIILLLFVSIVLEFTCCVNKNYHKGIIRDSIIKPNSIINPISQGVEVNDFRNIIDSISVIPLELSEESIIVDVRKILLTSNKKIIVLNASSILVFNASGKYLFQVGRIGKGPGEYIKINDICLGYNEDFILALDAYNNVFKYSMDDGTFIEKSLPQWKEKKGGSSDGICPAVDGYYLFCANPTAIDNFSEDFFCLTKFDWNGKYQESFLLRKDFNFNIKRITQSYNNSYFIRPLAGDSYLYLINNKGLFKILNITFGPKQIPPKYIFTFPGNPYQNIHNYIVSPYYKLPMGFHDTNEHLYFYCAGPNAISEEFLIDKNNSHVLRWNHKDKSPMLPIASDSTFFYFVYNDYSVNKDNEKARIDPLKQFVKNKENLTLLDNNSNPLLIKIKFSF